MDHGGLCTFRWLSGKFVILTNCLLFPYDSLSESGRRRKMGGCQTNSSNPALR